MMRLFLTLLGLFFQVFASLVVWLLLGAFGWHGEIAGVASGICGSALGGVIYIHIFNQYFRTEIPPPTP